MESALSWSQDISLLVLNLPQLATDLGFSSTSKRVRPGFSENAFQLWYLGVNLDATLVLCFSLGFLLFPYHTNFSVR